MMFVLEQDYAAHAELFKRKGNRQRAKEDLKRAVEICKECGADGWVTKVEETLTESRSSAGGTI